MKKKRLLFAVVMTAIVTGMVANAEPLIEMDFNDAEGGNPSLVNRGSISTNGSLVGNASYSRDDSSVHGPGGYAGTFDGNGDAIDLGDVANLSTTLTITAWINADSMVGGDRIVDKFLTSGGYTLFVNADGSLQLTFSNGSIGLGKSESGLISASAGWQFVAVTLDTAGSDSYAFYVGDETTAVSNRFNTIAGDLSVIGDTTTSLYIGDRSARDRSFDGLIDNVRIYDYVLSEAEVDSIRTFSDGSVPALIEMDFNDAEGGSPSLVNRGSISTNGSLVGNASYSRDDSSVHGPGGYAGTFDGDGDAIDLGDVANLSTTLTITAWINADSMDGGERIVDKYLSSVGYIFFVNADGSLQLTSSSGSPRYGRSESGLISTSAGWQFVAVTLDTAGSDSYAFYVGDETTAVSNRFNTIAGDLSVIGDTTTSLYIGDNSARDRSFDGLIDNVRIYDFVLSEAEVDRIRTFSDSSWVPNGTIIMMR